MIAKDRRRFARWEVGRSAKIKLEGAENYMHCSIREISLKGMQIVLGMKLQTDTFLKLSLALHEEFILELEVWVVWHKIVEGHNIYGLYFSKIKDQDKEKIYRYLCRFNPNHIKQQLCRDLEKGGETMEKQKFEDRRIFARFPAKFPARFINLDADKEGMAATYDVSAKGIGIVSEKALNPNSSLELWLQIPDKGEPLYTRGTVVWSKQESENSFRTGINLEKADLMGLSRVLRVA